MTSRNRQSLLRPTLGTDTSILQVTWLKKSRSKEIYSVPLVGGILKLQSKEKELEEANKQTITHTSSLHIK